MSSPNSEQYSLLDQLAEEFADRFRRGERPTLDEYIDRCPELADDIRGLFPAMVKMEQVEGVRQAEEEKQPGDSRAANRAMRQIGDYRILREVGGGGMGVVYEAEQISLGRRVALKVLPQQMSGDPMVRERFRREARAAARLHHTNIVPVYEVGQDADVRFYAMQFIQGQGLDSVIAELRWLRDRSGPEQRSAQGAEGQPSMPPEEHAHLGKEAHSPGDELEVSAVLQSVLDGRFDPGGRPPERMEVSQLTPDPSGRRRLATPATTGMEPRSANPTPRWHPR